MNIGDMLGQALKTVAGVVTGGLSDRVLDIVDSVVGEPLAPEKRAELKVTLERETTARTVAAYEAASTAERNLTDRVAKLEGTASDLMAMPLVGRLIIFLRGCQRPAWGFGTLWMDWQVFSGQWPLAPDSLTETAFWTINFLVLGFLFGERAIANVSPVLAALMSKK